MSNHPYLLLISNFLEAKKKKILTLKQGVKMKVAISFSSNINVSVENFIKMNFPQNSNSARTAFSKRNIFCLKTEEKKKEKKKKLAAWLPQPPYNNKAK